MVVADGVDLLYKEAKQSNVALVSHGMLNMFIEKYLKKLGYKRTGKVKNGFFSIITLEFDTESDIKN